MQLFWAIISGGRLNLAAFDKAPKRGMMLGMSSIFASPFFRLLLIGASVAVIIAVARPGRKNGSSGAGARAGFAPSPDASGLLRESGDKLGKLELLAGQLEDGEPARGIRRVCAAASEVLGGITRKPELISDMRYFMNYYMPELAKIAQDCVSIESGKASEQAVSDARASAVALAAEAEAAFRKLLDAMRGDGGIGTGATGTDAADKDGLP
jgi:hypothetical protein